MLKSKLKIYPFMSGEKRTIGGLTRDRAFGHELPAMLQLEVTQENLNAFAENEPVQFVGEDGVKVTVQEVEEQTNYIRPRVNTLVTIMAENDGEPRGKTVTISHTGHKVEITHSATLPQSRRTFGGKEYNITASHHGYFLSTANMVGTRTWINIKEVAPTQGYERTQISSIRVVDMEEEEELWITITLNDKTSSTFASRDGEIIAIDHVGERVEDTVIRPPSEIQWKAYLEAFRDAQPTLANLEADLGDYVEEAEYWRTFINLLRGG